MLLLLESVDCNSLHLLILAFLSLISLRSSAASSPLANLPICWELTSRLPLKIAQKLTGSWCCKRLQKKASIQYCILRKKSKSC
jgi:hypothetical protein